MDNACVAKSDQPASVLTTNVLAEAVSNIARAEDLVGRINICLHGNVPNCIGEDTPGLDGINAHARNIAQRTSDLADQLDRIYNGL